MYNNNASPDTWCAIAECERRLNAKRQQLADVKYELRLLEQDAFQMYSQSIMYPHFNIEAIQSAQRWICMIRNKSDLCGNKLDRRKKYLESMSFDRLTTQLRDLTKVDSLEIKNIISVNYNEAYSILFDYMDYEWTIRVPDVDAVTVDRYRKEGSSCFQLEVIRSNCLGSSGLVQVCRVVGSSFVESGLADIIQAECTRIQGGIL